MSASCPTYRIEDWLDCIKWFSSSTWEPPALKEVIHEDDKRLKSNQRVITKKKNKRISRSDAQEWKPKGNYKARRNGSRVEVMHKRMETNRGTPEDDPSPTDEKSVVTASSSSWEERDDAGVGLFLLLPDWSVLRGDIGGAR